MGWRHETALAVECRGHAPTASVRRERQAMAGVPLADKGLVARTGIVTAFEESVLDRVLERTFGRGVGHCRGRQ